MKQHGMSIAGSRHLWLWDWEMDWYVTSTDQTPCELKELVGADACRAAIEDDELVSADDEGTEATSWGERVTGTLYVDGDVVLGLMVVDPAYGAWMYTPPAWKNVDWEEHAA